MQTIVHARPLLYNYLGRLASSDPAGDGITLFPKRCSVAGANHMTDWRNDSSHVTDVVDHRYRSIPSTEIVTLWVSAGANTFAHLARSCLSLSVYWKVNSVEWHAPPGAGWRQRATLKSATHRQSQLFSSRTALASCLLRRVVVMFSQLRLCLRLCLNCCKVCNGTDRLTRVLPLEVSANISPIVPWCVNQLCKRFPNDLRVELINAPSRHYQCLMFISVPESIAFHTCRPAHCLFSQWSTECGGLT